MPAGSSLLPDGYSAFGHFPTNAAPLFSIASSLAVVPDTNVLVSAIVFGGPPSRLVELAAEGYLQLVLSPSLIGELREVLRRKFDFSDAAAYQAEAILRRISVIVEPQREVAIITEEPEDNRVLEEPSRATQMSSSQATAICLAWRSLARRQS